MKQWFNHQQVRIWLPPTVGFLFYGAWAFSVNSGVLLISDTIYWSTGIKAALVQGSYSFFVTLMLAIVVEWMFVRLRDVAFKPMWVWLTAVLLLIATSSGLNVLAGTPHVLFTILPGLLVSAIYTALYIIALNKIFKD